MFCVMFKIKTFYHTITKYNFISFDTLLQLNSSIKKFYFIQKNEILKVFMIIKGII